MHDVLTYIARTNAWNGIGKFMIEHAWAAQDRVLKVRKC